MKIIIMDFGNLTPVNWTQISPLSAVNWTIILNDCVANCIKLNYIPIIRHMVYEFNAGDICYIKFLIAWWRFTGSIYYYNVGYSLLLCNPVTM